MEKYPEYIEKEMNVLETFDKKIKSKIKDTVKEIHAKIPLDYFGIDCYVDDRGNITIFELNANMNVLIHLDEKFIKYTDKIKKAINKMITKGMNNY
jgi:glutathione synthase/RimK-type ligase-like ATP-grasp enzyme